jgi:hypothetical protein
MSSARGIFPGYITDAGLVTFDEPTKAHAFNREHFGDHEVFVEIYKRRSKRSLRQNSAYHAAIGPFAEHLGYTVEELKLAMLGGCFGWKTVIGGAEVPEMLHTSDLNTEQFSDLMAYTMQKAAEHDVLILDPSQWKAEKRKRERKQAAPEPDPIEVDQRIQRGMAPR